MFMRVHYWFHCWGLMIQYPAPHACPHSVWSFPINILYQNFVWICDFSHPWFMSSSHLIEFNLFIIGTLDKEYKLWCFLLCIILHPSVPSSFLGPNVLLSTLFWNLCYLFGPALNLCNRRGDTWFYCPVYFHIIMWKKDGTNYNKNYSKETWL